MKAIFYVYYSTRDLKSGFKFRRTVEAESALEAAIKPIEQMKSTAFLRLFTRCTKGNENRGEGGKIKAHVYNENHTWKNGMPGMTKTFTLAI